MTIHFHVYSKKVLHVLMIIIAISKDISILSVFILDAFPPKKNKLFNQSFILRMEQLHFLLVLFHATRIALFSLPVIHFQLLSTANFLSTFSVCCFYRCLPISLIPFDLHVRFDPFVCFECFCQFVNFFLIFIFPFPYW